MIVDGPTHEPVEQAATPRWRAAPHWPFHAFLALALLVLMWSMTLPGVDLQAFGVATLAIIGAGAVWSVRLVGWAWLPVRPPGRRWLIAPAIVLLTVVLLATGTPGRARFELARADFDAYVAELEPRGDVANWVPVDAPAELGSFEILWAYQAGDNVIIYEATGAFLSDAGFAHLPDGPDTDLANESFASPVFTSLGGGWYSWTASGWDW